MDPLELAELLCARICHDLAGPVGAASAGAELFEDMGGSADPETLSLVAASAAGAAIRLKFFRAALGPAASAPQSAASLREAIDAYLRTLVSGASPGIQMAWRVTGPALSGEAARLLLNMALLAKDALPRGGRMDVELVDNLPKVIAWGEPASLTGEARAVLVDGLAADGPKGAQAEFARILAERLGGKLTVSLTPQGLALTVER